MKQPFFLLGTGRCGSTFLYSILRAHPQVVMTNEANVLEFFRVTRILAQTPVGQKDVAGDGIVSGEYSAQFTAMYLEHARQMMHELLELEAKGKDYSHWGDKLPQVESLSLIRELYPKSRFIRLVRDPRDVLCSVRRFQHKLPNPPAITQQDLRTQCERFLYVHTVIDRFAGEHFSIRYEELVAEPRRVVGECLAYLGLEEHADCLAVLEQQDTFSGHGTSSSPAQSVGRYRDELSAEDLQVTNEVLGPFLERWGYPA